MSLLTEAPPDAHTMPLYEGVTLSLLTAMSLLALVGVFRPVRMLPVPWGYAWRRLVSSTR